MIDSVLKKIYIPIIPKTKKIKTKRWKNFTIIGIIYRKVVNTRLMLLMIELLSPLQ